eukprot:Nitzschia sp. Nitz4//scaffold5_size260463//105132//106133//NITZ4_000975-RA/size260463-processed-gene-0.316-mRNA-1//1//CDS//3329555319//2430//frame0
MSEISCCVHSFATPTLPTGSLFTVPQTLSPDSSFALLKDPTKLRYRCRVSYDGKRFSGYQYNPSTRTVQGVLEQALTEHFQRHIRVVGTSRTDAGVHARGQAIHFDLFFDECDTVENQIWNRQVELALNRLLPDDIRVWNVGPAPPVSNVTTHGKTNLYNWDAMRSCDSKLYCYRLCLSRFAMDARERHWRWQPNLQAEQVGLEPTRLHDALQAFEGSHDFTCFAGSLVALNRELGFEVTTTRTIRRCRLVLEDRVRQHYRMEVELEGAMYKMVRNLVGTAIDVWKGDVTTQLLHNLLHDPDTLARGRVENPSKPAPPYGLTLEQVHFRNDSF